MLKCWIFNPCLDTSLKGFLCDSVTNFSLRENLMTQLFRLWVYGNWTWLSRLTAKIIVFLAFSLFEVVVVCLFACFLMFCS